MRFQQQVSQCRNWAQTGACFVGDLGILMFQSVRCVLRGRLEASETLVQMVLVGVYAVPMVMIASGFTGAVLALYSAQLMQQYGVGSLVGGAVALACARELSPVVTGVVVAARSASAIAAELGTMKVTEQIDALRALGVPPVQYLVVPRLLAGLVMLPMLGTVAFVMGVFGGYVVSVSYGIAPVSYLMSIQELLVPRDVLLGLVKTIVFGGLIALVGCRYGLQAEGGAAGVGMATTRSVVSAVLLVYITNFIMAYLFFGN